MAERSNQRVLIVDDEVDFVLTLQDILEAEGYSVTVAHDPEGALEQVRAAGAPLVALLDVRLGRSSGIDLLASLREAAPGLLFVMMTAYADVDTALQALAQGAYQYLRKPIEPRELLATLERCSERVRLEREKQEAEAALVRRNAELAEVNTRLRQMVAAAQGLASTTRLPELSHGLLAECARVMAAGGGSLFFRRDDDFELVCSLDDDHVPARLPLPFPADSVFGRVLESKTPLVVRDIASAGDLHGSGWRGYRDGSLLVYPLLVGDEVAALLSLHNKAWPPFTEQDKELGQIMISLSVEILKALQATDAVRASEERYRLLAENALDVIFTADASLRLTYVSPSVTRLTGLSVREVLERGLEGLLTPACLAPTRAALAAALPGGDEAASPAPRTLDVDLPGRAGTTVHAEVTVSGVRGPNGPSLLCVARDVGERRRAQEQLARLATVVEQAVEDVIITDESGVIVYVNPAFERATGYTRQEAVGRNPRILRSGAHDSAFYAEMWRTITGGGVWRGRVTNRRKDGSHMLEEGSVSPIRDADGRITGFVSAKYDVTRQAALEAQLAQVQRTESIGRLAGGIAHDFNNILAAIMGFAELLERAALQPEKLRRYVRGISEASARAADLTRQILTFSRQGSLDRAPLAVGVVVRDVLKLMRAALPTTIAIRHDARSEATVAANASQLHQVVLNLCTNAGLAMRERGGLLEVTLADVIVDPTMRELCPPLGPGRHVCLSVSDNGSGMTPEVLSRAFEPFFTTRQPEEGTGMGLAVVQGIVRDHGGLVTAASTPGVGSTFRVFLPAVPSVPGPAAGEAPPALGSERVLFVDDEAVQIELARQMLGSLGYRVTTAGSAAEALAFVGADPGAFDVVVTDTTMPGMPGDVLAGELLKLRGDLPVVLCTGFSERASEARLQALGVRGLLLKPYTLGGLSAAIRSALAARTAPGSA